MGPVPPVGAQSSNFFSRASVSVSDLCMTVKKVALKIISTIGQTVYSFYKMITSYCFSATVQSSKKDDLGTHPVSGTQPAHVDDDSSDKEDAVYESHSHSESSSLQDAHSVHNDGDSSDEEGGVHDHSSGKKACSKEDPFDPCNLGKTSIPPTTLNGFCEEVKAKKKKTEFV